MTTKRRITLEITVSEPTNYVDVALAIMHGLTTSGPPGEIRIVGLSDHLVDEVVVLRAPEDRREGVRAQGDA